MKVLFKSKALFIGIKVKGTNDIKIQSHDTKETDQGPVQ
jgi:hypothetical protein